MRHLIYIGPDKCGSSWLHRLFAAHPEVAVPKIKDPFYFDRHYHLGAAWYDRLYPESSSIRSDVSHDYLFSHAAIERISGDLDDVSLVVGVRDPLDRALSAYRYMQSQGRIAPSMNFADALASVDELLDHGDYGKHLERWLEAFDSDRFVFLDFAELTLDSRACAAGLCLRLGLSAPSAELLEQLSVVTNPARRSRRPAVVRSLRTASNAVRRTGASRVVQRAKESPTLTKLLFAERSADDRRQDTAMLARERESHQARTCASLRRAAALTGESSFLELVRHYES